MILGCGGMRLVQELRVSHEWDETRIVGDQVLGFYGTRLKIIQYILQLRAVGGGGGCTCTM